MDIETVRTKMMEQICQVQQSAMTRAYGWTYAVQDLMVYVVLRHRRRSGNAYLLRGSFEEFPRRAPSYVFVDPDTKEVTPAAWPPHVQHGAEPPGICTPGTREFHEHWHKNDQQYPWDAARYPFLDTLQRIHRLLEQGLGG